MIIQHNIAALNAHRQLGGNNGRVSKNLEKLSSGFKINRAGDDAAGLAISEKMRAQIKGLETASKNANDGISLIQTAEGSLTEVHSMLNRMVELATQSANGTYGATERQKLQDEVSSLKEEIDRIGDSTNFNGINLLEGSLGGSAKITASGGSGATADTYIFTAGGAINGLSGISVANPSAAGDVELTAEEVGDSATGFQLFGSDFTMEGGTTKIGELAGKTVKIQFGGTAAAEVGADGNITITLDSTTMADYDTAAKLETAVNAALGGTLTGAGTADQKAAWGEVTITAGVGGTYGAPVAADTATSGAMTAGGIKVSTSGTGAGTAVDKTFTMAEWVDNAQLTVGNISFKLDNAANAITALNTAQTIGTNAVDVAGTAGTAGKAEVDLVNQPKAGSTIKIGDATYEFVTNAADVKQGNNAVVIGANAAATAQAFKTAADANAPTGVTVGALNGTKIEFSNTDTTDTVAPTVTQKGGGLSLQVGDTADSFQMVDVSIGSMKSSALGLNAVDVSTDTLARNSIKAIKDAIETVSTTRGNLGALQNRLDHTINNLGVTTENMTAAESRIRDVDMAKEMMDFTKNNILTQAAQAMLAQANQIPQGVLQLLQ